MSFGGVSESVLKSEARLVHKLLRKKHFAPEGYVQLGNMPCLPVHPDDSNVEIFHDRTVQLCLNYKKIPQEVGDSWWLESVPGIYCHVYVVFKVYKSKEPKVMRYEVAMGWEGCDPYESSSGTLDKAYEKAAKKVNRDIDRMIKFSYC